MNNNLYKHQISAEVSEYLIPPVKDILILGKNAPIGCIAMRRALELLIKTPYEHIEIKNDEVISDILVRQPLLRRIPKETLLQFVMHNIKPLLDPEEVLHVTIDVKVLIHAENHETTHTR